MPRGIPNKKSEEEAPKKGKSKSKAIVKAEKAKPPAKKKAAEKKVAKATPKKSKPDPKKLAATDEYKPRGVGLGTFGIVKCTDNTYLSVEVWYHKGKHRTEIVRAGTNGSILKGGALVYTLDENAKMAEAQAFIQANRKKIERGTEFDCFSFLFVMMDENLGKPLFKKNAKLPKGWVLPGQTSPAASEKPAKTSAKEEPAGRRVRVPEPSSTPEDEDDAEVEAETGAKRVSEKKPAKKASSDEDEDSDEDEELDARSLSSDEDDTDESLGDEDDEDEGEGEGDEDEGDDRDGDGDDDVDEDDPPAGKPSKKDSKGTVKKPKPDGKVPTTKPRR